MKILVCLLVAAATSQAADSSSTVIKPGPPPPNRPNIVRPVARTSPPPAYSYEQKTYGGKQPLVTQEQAKAVLDRFKAGYPKLGSPRLLIYVERELLDEESDMKLAGRAEKTEGTRTEVKSEFQTDPNAPQTTNSQSVTTPAQTPAAAAHHPDTPGRRNVFVRRERSSAENTYQFQAHTTGTLADKQTVRDLERYFGRPLRTGGASLADQRVAAQLIGDKPLKDFTVQSDGAQAQKDRAALNSTTDVVVEILVSNREINVPGLSGDRIYSVPEIQATAIRLSDSRILAQASSRDVLANGPGREPQDYGAREVVEATALALMEDMLVEASP